MLAVKQEIQLLLQNPRGFLIGQVPAGPVSALNGDMYTGKEVCAFAQAK